MPVRYVIRAFGGTLIINTGSPSLPTVLVVAQFRSAVQTATFRSGQATGGAR